MEVVWCSGTMSIQVKYREFAMKIEWHPPPPPPWFWALSKGKKRNSDLAKGECLEPKKAILISASEGLLCWLIEWKLPSVQALSCVNKKGQSWLVGNGALCNVSVKHKSEAKPNWSADEKEKSSSFPLKFYLFSLWMIAVDHWASVDRWTKLWCCSVKIVSVHCLVSCLA